MKKTYAKPGLESRTFAQFENVFTACTRNLNNPDQFPNCTYCGGFNPGVDVSPECIECGQTESAHSRHVDVSGS